MGTQAEYCVRQGLQDRRVRCVEARGRGQGCSRVERGCPEAVRGRQGIPLREEPSSGCVQLAGAVVRGQRGAHAAVRSTTVPLLAFTVGVAWQAPTRGFSTDWARPDWSLSHMACKLGSVNLAGPSPSVPATRSAIIWLPSWVLSPWAVSMSPMIGE